MKILSHFAMAMAILSATAMVTTPQAAFAQKEKKEKKKKKKGKKNSAAQEEGGAPSLAVSEGFYASFQTNKALLDAGNAAQVKAGLPAMEALIQNESDSYVYGDFVYSVGRVLKDRDLELKGIERVIPSAFLPERNKQVFTYVQGSYAMDRKDYPIAVAKLTDSYNMGYRGGNIEFLLGIAHSNNNAPEQGIDWYQKGIDIAVARDPAYDKTGFLNNMAIAAIRSDNPVLISNTFQRILPQTDDERLWHDGLAQLSAKSGFKDQENLDVLRLMKETDSILFANEFAEYAQTADPRRLPKEVLDVINSGVSKGVIEAGDVTFADYISIANARVAADRADLVSAEADAKNSANGNSARATADALLSYDEYARAITMYELAIQKGGIDNDRAYNRLGIAQVKSGQFDAARKSFASIVGPERKAIAAYWTIYTNNLEAKMTAKAAPVAAVN